MPLIEYGGHTPVVSVPEYQLRDVEYGVPVEVPERVAAVLTLGGVSPTWRRLTDDEAEAWFAAQADDETPEG